MQHKSTISQPDEGCELGPMAGAVLTGMAISVLGYSILILIFSM